MAYSFQNGLYLDNSVSYHSGAVLQRWMREFTRVCGLTRYDASADNWDNVIDDDTDGFTDTTNPALFSSTGYTFTNSAEGVEDYLTITGFTDTTRNGIYRIVQTVGGAAVLDIQQGVHEEGLPLSETGLTWRYWNSTSAYTPDVVGSWQVIRGSYSTAPAEPNWDALFTTQAALLEDCMFPSCAFSSFGTWDNGAAHAWSDSRYIAEKLPTQYIRAAHGTRVYACGDDQRCIFFTANSYNGVTGHYNMYYFGEGNALQTADTNPGFIICGGGLESTKALGSGAGATSDTIYNSARFLSIADDTTNLTPYFLLPQSLSIGGVPTALMHKYHAGYEAVMQRLQLLIRSVTTGHIFQRTPVDLWIGDMAYQPLTPFGADREYIHLWHGLSMPWNGSQNFFRPPSEY